MLACAGMAILTGNDDRPHSRGRPPGDDNARDDMRILPTIVLLAAAACSTPAPLPLPVPGPVGPW